jgi:hypothetical protein
MTRYWIGVASYEHVRRGVNGGFAQLNLNHGKAAPLHRMAAGDWLIYYSPREQREGDEPVQAFTALGQLAGDEVTEVAMTESFTAARHAVHWMPAHPARPSSADQAPAGIAQLHPEPGAVGDDLSPWPPGDQ